MAFGLACGDAGEGLDRGPLEIAGVYANSFSRELVIDGSRWDGYPVLARDNASNRLVFRVEAGPAGSEGYWRVVWTEPAARGGFFYCFEVRGASSLELARSAEVFADASDPRVGGCGAFPWAQAWPSVPLRGEYDGPDGIRHTVTATVWRRGSEELFLAAWDNEREYLVARNDPDAVVDPGLYRLVEWTAGSGGGWSYCDVEAGFATAEAAYTFEPRADRRDPMSGGCGGEAWARLEVPR